MTQGVKRNKFKESLQMFETMNMLQKKHTERLMLYDLIVIIHFRFESCHDIFQPTIVINTIEWLAKRFDLS